MSMATMTVDCEMNGALVVKTDGKRVGVVDGEGDGDVDGEMDGEVSSMLPMPR